MLGQYRQHTCSSSSRFGGNTTSSRAECAGLPELCPDDAHSPGQTLPPCVFPGQYPDARAPLCSVAIPPVLGYYRQRTGSTSAIQPVHTFVILAVRCQYHRGGNTIMRAFRGTTPPQSAFRGNTPPPCAVPGRYPDARARLGSAAIPPVLVQYR